MEYINKIEIRSKFSGWKNISREEALEYAKWKIKAITMGENDEERLAMINKQLRGVQFVIGQLKEATL